MVMERNDSLDILKGIGITLMIVAHTYGPNNPLWNCIYAFHIPLFFLVTGYFFKQSSISILLKKGKDKLLIQYITLCSIITLLTQLREPHNVTIDIKGIINGMGPGWFLLAMFMGRFAFHLILQTFTKSYLLISLAISMSICGIASCNKLPSFLSIFSGLVSLFFIAVGYFIRTHSLHNTEKKHPIIYLLIGLLFWLITSIWGEVEMSQCIFKLSFIDFCGSLGGTYIVYKLCKFIEKKCDKIKCILSHAGKYSLVILFFHSIDYCIPIWYLIEPYFPSSVLLTVILILRLLFVYLCLKITLRTNLLRSFFHI